MISCLGAAGTKGDKHRLSRKLVYFPQQFYDADAIAANASVVRDRTAQFDMMTVTTQAGKYGVADPGNALNSTTLNSQLAAFDAANTGDMKFIYIYRTNIDRPPNYDNAGHWTTLAGNITTLANALKTRPRFMGIFWDWEYYGGSPYWLQWPEGDTSSATLAISRAKAQSRAKQIGDALFAAWPGANFSSSHGPGNSETLQSHYLGPTYGTNIAGNDLSSHNDLMGPVFMGFMQAHIQAGSGIVQDGNELYAVRSQQDVHRVRKFSQRTLPTVSPIITSDLKPLYHSSHGQGLYDRSDEPGFSLVSAATTQTMVANAMKQAGGYVWYYTETHEWLGFEGASGKPTVPSDYLNAVAEGRRIGRL